MLVLRAMLSRLGKTIDPGTTCRAFEREYGEITWDDLEMLAAVEDLDRTEFAQDGENGEGC